jgi:hypothetical protein
MEVIARQLATLTPQIARFVNMESMLTGRQLSEISSD